MKIFRIRNDVNWFQCFLPNDEEDWPKLGGECQPILDGWTPPPVYVLYPTREEGDFYQFGSGALITSPRATEALRTHLEMAGELLPLPHGGVTYTLLNVLECVNCLDHARTEWLLTPDGTRVRPLKYAFHPKRLTETRLFKIPETCRGEILVSEGADASEHGEFREALEEAGLRGLVFEEIWRLD